MDVAAQQVQRQIQGVADEGDDHEAHHVPGGGTQHIEYLRQHGARQHQRHQTHIGEDIAEKACDAVIYGAHQPRDLAEALLAPAGAVYQHQHADDQHHRHTGHAAHLQERHGPAGQNDPPRDLVPQGVGKVAVPGFLHHADGHAGEDLDAAQHHGADHDGHGVVQRREEAGQLKGAGRVNDLAQLGDEVPEEAAGESAENKGHDAAPQDQLDKAPFALRRSCLFQVQQRQKDHQKAVAHVRHHHAEEQDEKRGHDRVGVHAVIGGHGVLLRDAGHGSGEPVALQRHRHLRILLLGGDPQIPRTGVALQQLLQPGGVCLRHPALQIEDMSVGEEPLAVLFPLNLQIQAVQTQLQLRLTASQGVQRSVLRPAILPGLLLLIVQPLQVLLHRTGEGTEGGRRKAEGPQHLQHCALRRLMYQQQKILLLRRQGYLYQLRRLFLQSVFCLLEVRPQGHGAGDHRQLAAAVQLQRHV